MLIMIQTNVYCTMQCTQTPHKINVYNLFTIEEICNRNSLTAATGNEYVWLTYDEVNIL